MNQSFKKLSPYFILLFVVILGYWQISFFVHALKWDTIDVVFPFRFYFSECIQSGYFPFWNPYLQTGTPFFADLQAPTFYPELLYTGLFSGYSIYTMHFLFVLYVFIAGTGMYQLAFHFYATRNASLLAAITYSFSGFIIGHGQHFFLLVGTAWIPFVVVNYLRLNKERSFINSLKTAVFIFLMISGAYQALSFTLLYLLILLFLYFLIKQLVQKNFKGIRDLFKVNFFLLIWVLVFSLPLIVSALDILSSVNRLESGVSLSQTCSYGQSLKSLISLVLPFSILKYSTFFGGVDLSMRNHYFGIIPLVFFFMALFRKRTVPEYLILGFGLLIFASSFSSLHVREVMFRYIPLMNLFKYAAFIRVFGLLAFILLAAGYFAYFQRNTKKEKRRILFPACLLFIALVALLIFSTGKLTWQSFNELTFNNGFAALIESMSFYQVIVVQALFQLLILGLFLLCLKFTRNNKYSFAFILVLLFADMFATSQLNMPVTATDSHRNPKQMEKDLSLFPDKFPLPVDGKIRYNDRKHAAFDPFWRNTYNFTKQVSFKAFSSFELNTYNKLDDDYPNLRNAVLNNHLFYFSDRIFPVSQFADSCINPETDARHLYLSESDFSLLSGKTVSADSTDVIQMSEFAPNRVIIHTNTRNDQFLTMLQTNFKGWEAFIDGNKVPVYTSNFNYRTIYLPEGSHTVSFKYTNRKILFLYIFSNVVFLMVVLFLTGYAIRRRNRSGKLYLFIPLILLLIVSVFLIKALSHKDPNYSAIQEVNKRYHQQDALFSQHLDFETEETNADDSLVFAGRKSLLINPDMEFFTIANLKNSNLQMKNGTLVITAKLYPESYVEGLIVSDVPGDEGTWHASKIEKHIEGINRWNELIYYRNFYDLQENDEIRIYLWNLKGAAFRIDELSLNLYSMKY